MADTGVWRMWESKYFKEKIWPPFKTVYPTDAKKVEKVAAGDPAVRPSSAFALGIYEEMKLHPRKTTVPDLSFGLYSKPTVMCHNARGGVEYQEEMVKYFGSAMLDVNSPPDAPWDVFRARATKAGLPTVMWQHVHTYDQIQNLLNICKVDGTGGINLEDITSEKLEPAKIASMIDATLGKDSICAIPTLGWIQDKDWSPLNRHVFLLEFFPNDPSPDWVGKDLLTLVRQCAQHARSWGVLKLTFVCGIYDASPNNPNAKTYTAAEYKAAIRTAGERFGGIYLGDNNGSNYAKWA